MGIGTNRANRRAAGRRVKPMGDTRAIGKWRTFHCTEDRAYKFWGVQVVQYRDGEAVQRVRFGRIGTAGQEQEKAFGRFADATEATDKLIKAKLAKGYVEVFGQEITARLPKPKYVQLDLFDPPGDSIREADKMLPLIPVSEPAPASLSLF